MEQGGDCADRSRLVIRMLRLHGIGASKWALYTKEMKSVHAVVELEAETGKMVADPDFGLWFPRPAEGIYGIRGAATITESILARSDSKFCRGGNTSRMQ